MTAHLTGQCTMYSHVFTNAYKSLFVIFFLVVQALAVGIILCSLARDFTLTMPLSTQVYKSVLANLMLGGNPALDYHSIHNWLICRLYLLQIKTATLKRQRNGVGGGDVSD